MTIKRYEYDQNHGMFEAEDGEWVLWEDVQPSKLGNTHREGVPYSIQPIHGPPMPKAKYSPACGDFCEFCD